MSVLEEYEDEHGLLRPEELKTALQIFRKYKSGLEGKDEEVDVEKGNVDMK